MTSWPEEIKQYREVVYEPTFDSELKAIHPSFQRAEEFVDGAVWILARSPESGHRISTTSNVWMLPVAQVDDIPHAAIFYTFTNTHVWLLSIKRSD